MKKRINKISLVYLVLIALFTISSFVFDQLVIHQEDKINNLQSRYTTNESNLHGKNNVCMTYISIANKLANVIYSSSIRFEIYTNLSNISNDEEYLSSIRKTNKKLYQAYYNANFSYFLNELDYRYIHVLLNGELNLEKKYQKSFTEKFSKQYNDIGNSIKSLINEYSNFQKNPTNGNLLLNFYNNAQILFKDISLLSFNFSQEQEYACHERDILQNNIAYILTDLTNQNSYKNFFILFSVISQIFSLLFLTLLFKKIIAEIKTRKVKKLKL